MGSRNKNKPRLSQRAKQERRKDMSEIQEKIFSVVVPVIVTFAMVIVLIIYVKTRPRTDL
uniref:Single-pass membrane and coiled-coil domain-containing protein 4 homolog n=1 Tax=Amblyomma maculatum TaxID=34609 RepID=G3MPC5_AMBMU